MTYDLNDFKTKSIPRRQAISNANGYIYPVTGGETMELSTTFTLPKLLLVGQVTENLNCCVLMYSLFCLF
jgi:hypothetical protein